MEWKKLKIIIKKQKNDVYDCFSIIIFKLFVEWIFFDCAKLLKFIYNIIKPQIVYWNNLGKQIKKHNILNIAYIQPIVNTRRHAKKIIDQVVSTTRRVLFVLGKHSL